MSAFRADVGNANPWVRTESKEPKSMAHQEITEADLRARTRKLLAEAHPDKVDQFTFRGKQYDHGLAWVHFPEGFGGLGISPGMQAIVADELAKHAKTHY